MQEVLRDTATKILLASIRDVPSMVTLARHGVECFTFGPSVAWQFFDDELTASAVVEFEEAVRG
jgi:transaldolase